MQKRRNKNNKELTYSREVIYTYYMWVAYWNLTLTLNISLTPKKKKKEIVRLKFYFESTCFGWINLCIFWPRLKLFDLMEYIEVKNYVWSARGFSSAECESFVSHNIFWRRRQAGAKKVFVCITIGVCRRVWWSLERDGM